jgi:transaldolase
MRRGSQARRRSGPRQRRAGCWIQAQELGSPTARQVGADDDGWHNPVDTIAAAANLHRTAQPPNLFIKIPGAPEGVRAIEATIFAGVPVNVTLLFSREQCVAAAQAYLRGIERRIAAGLDPNAGSVASIFVSRWDVAANAKVPPQLRNRLGVAIAKRAYQAYRELLASPRWQQLAVAGARPQRLLWASAGTKDPDVSDTLYIESLAAPDTINTVPDRTMHAFADHGELKGVLPVDGGDAEDVLAEFARAGVDDPALAAQLQREGAESFGKSWKDLLDRIAAKSAMLEKGDPTRAGQP